MKLSSVIVFQIDVDGIAFDPAKYNAPVSAGVDRIAALVATDQRMKAEPRQIHILWPRGVVERPQNVGYPFRILHAEPASVSGREKPFERFVSERADHVRSVRQWLTIVKKCLTMPLDVGQVT
jgi:hypothetical protein